MTPRIDSAYVGEDVPIKMVFEDPDTGDPVDPDDTDSDGTPDVTLTITGPNGTEHVTDAAMSNPSVGEYEYVWDTATDASGTGEYTAETTADFNGETKIERVNIRLK